MGKTIKHHEIVCKNCGASITKKDIVVVLGKEYCRYCE
jgi:formylmethanofuran dehydrogenase subunit E